MGFSDDKVAFMKSQPLARIATVSDDGQPDVVPVGFEFDGTYINIGGYQPSKTRRHHSVLAGHHKVALVIDDLVSTQPWSPRFLRVYGTAEVVTCDQPYLRVTPQVSWSWNLSGERERRGQTSGLVSQHRGPSRPTQSQMAWRASLTTHNRNLRVTPKISWSWNLAGQPFTYVASFTPPKRTVHH